MNGNISAITATSGRTLVVPAAPQTQEGRIRAALGVMQGPLPRVVTKWLVRYFVHLAERLSLPFEARSPEETGVLRPWTSNVTVTALLPPTEAARDEAGLLCKVVRGGEISVIPLFELEVERDHPNAQLIEDYWYWFWNWQFDPKI